MNDIIFTRGFTFLTINFDKFHHTDNRSGVQRHYFAYMLSGRCKITTNSETMEINEGDIFYIPNKCSYQSYWYGKPEVKFISLGFLYLPNIDRKSYPVQTIPFNENAAKIFRLLANTTQLSSYDIGLFYTLAGILLPLMSSKKICRTEEITTQTENYLLQNPFASAAELAKNCAISKAALYSAFKKSSDITLNRLKNKILLERAKEMLITTDKPIEYISDLMRFSSPSYFRKKFKQQFNISPREMRKNNRV